MDALSTTFAALADPTRRAILARLARGDAAVGELAAPFDISLPAVSRHLRVLADAQLIERRTDAQWRVCRLRPQPLKQAGDWIEHYRRFWESSLDRLAEVLEQSAATQPRRRAVARGNPAPGKPPPANARRADRTSPEGRASRAGRAPAADSAAHAGRAPRAPVQARKPRAPHPPRPKRRPRR